MPNPCSSGNAQPKAGTGVVVALTSAALQILLEARGYRWLSLIVGAVPQFSLDADDYCQNGQPALPNFTATDAQAVLNLAPPDELATALGKIRDVCLYYLWYDLCDCNGGTAAAPAAPQAPVPVTGGPGDAGDVSCCTGIGTNNPWTNNQNPPGWALAFIEWAPDISTPIQQGQCASTLRKIRWGYHRELGAGAHEYPLPLQRVWRHGGLVNDPHLIEDFTVDADDYEETIIVPPGGWTSFTTNFYPTAPNANDIMHGFMDGYCDAQPARSASDCCPPDPNIAQQLTDLAAQLALVKAQVDLVQRQAAPFGYVQGALHQNLSGDGHVDVADLIGCQVLMTQVPQDMGFEVAEVFEVFSDSWINWGTNASSSPREILRGYQQFSFPLNAGLYTRISYHLRPGLKVAIRELVREP